MGLRVPNGDCDSAEGGARVGLRVRFELVDASEPDDLTIDAGSFVWVGVLGTDATTAAAPRERARVLATEAGVSVSAATWVLDVLRALPLPPPGFLELARWLWANDASRAGRLADGSLPGDECLRLALAHTDPRTRTVRRHDWTREPLIADLPTGAVLSEVAIRPSGDPVAVSVGPEGAVEIAWTDAAGPHRRALSAGTHRGRLVAPLEASDDVLVARYTHERSECELFVDGLAGDWSSPLVFTLASSPTCWFLAEGRLWVHGVGETVGVCVDASRRRVAGDEVRIPQPAQRNAVTELPIRLGHYVTSAYVEPGVDPKRAVRSLAWVDLRVPDRRVVLGTAYSPPTMFVHDGELYATSMGELHRARPGESAEVLARGAFRGAAFAGDGDVIWLGETHANEQCVTRLCLRDAQVLSRTRVPFLTQTLVAVGAGVLAMSALQAAYVDAAGALVALSAQRRNPGWARLSDGTFVFGSGEEVFVISPAGELVRKRMMPFDGMILGTVADHAVFGPCPGGWDLAEPSAIHVLDARGESVATLRPEPACAPRVPMRTSWPNGALRTTRVGIESAVLTLDDSGRTLVSHRPVPEPAETTVPAASLSWLVPARTRERVIRGHRTNPRDDWKEAGLVVRGEALVARECTYAGTTGVVEGAALEAHDGAVVVLLDCDLREGGIDIVGDALVILVRCTIGPKTRKIGPTGRVFELDCRSA